MPKYPIAIMVEGEPVPKQSFRYTKNGGGFTDPRMKRWQTLVAYKAKEAMQGKEPITGEASVRMIFTLSNRRRVDLDNLSKGTLDGLRGIVIDDDSQVINLHLVKMLKISSHPESVAGVFITVYPGGMLPPFWIDNEDSDDD